MKIVITGGHHSSALPVIARLKEKESGIEISWIGHKYSVMGDRNTTLEYREITDLGIPFYHLHAGKLYKTLNIVRLLKVPYGFFQAIFLLLKLRPTIILSFGGYLAAPVVLAGWILRIPSITHEQTVVAGYANRFISRFVRKVLVSWPESGAYFPEKKVVVTGLPIRKEIFEPGSNSFDLEWDIPTIYITAGKTGSVKINKAVYDNMEKLLHLANVIHQCGDHSEYNYFNKLAEKYDQIMPQVPGKYYARKFVLRDEIGEAFRKSDLVITRAGAHITAELLALEKPALLIPIPWVSHNEQYLNAEVIKNSGLGEILDENALEDNFMETVSSMIGNIMFYKLKDVKYREIFNKDSAGLIAEEVINNAKQNT
jgi:UDP-N-acetylglucosamine--N-acetylmuramyl-(pentapeptide) pyrophosphoryl-undecaprenol N-acetylglucosamine transferase